MKRVKSLADLQKIKEQQQKVQQPRETEAGKIIVGMGTCGIAAGARDIMLAVMEEIDKRGVEVNITQTGCIGMCEQEPLIDVQLTPGERTTYGKVTPELARKIVAEHVVNGCTVKDAAIARLQED